MLNQKKAVIAALVAVAKRRELWAVEEGSDPTVGKPVEVGFAEVIAHHQCRWLDR
jgi:hypothetical protein